MKEFIEKLVGRLEELITDTYYKSVNGSKRAGIENNAYHNVKSIVNELVEKYKNGWILCSDMLPEEHDSIFAKFKGTGKWNDAMFEKISDEVNVTVVGENGKRTTTHAHTVDGEWNCDLLRANKSYQIIAWQPLPAPYQRKESRHGNLELHNHNRCL